MHEERIVNSLIQRTVMGDKDGQKKVIRFLLNRNMLWGSKELVLRIANERKKIKGHQYEEIEETWE